MAGDANADPLHVESARLCDLYTEVFADRGSLLAAGSAADAIAALLKVETGLAEVCAESYLRQADEIFAQASPRAEQLTHPEAFIRARALALWESKGEGRTRKPRGCWKGTRPSGPSTSSRAAASRS